MHAYSGVGNRTPALGAIAVASVVLSITLGALFDLVNVGPAWLFSAPAVAASYGLLYQAMDRWMWRWKLFRSLGLVDVPDIEGRYVGYLVSSFNKVRLPVHIDIDQTWTQIAVVFQVNDPPSSTSVSTAASLSRQGHNTARLSYTYRNAIRPGVAASDMTDHDGTADVVISAGELKGRYYNFRGRQGTLDLHIASS